MSDWQTVWRHFNERRVDLGWSWRKLYQRTQISESTFRSMRNGVALKDSARQARACIGVGWSSDSIALILRGAGPEVTASRDLLNALDRGGGLQRGLGALVPVDVNRPGGLDELRGQVAVLRRALLALLEIAVRDGVQLPADVLADVQELRLAR